MISKQIITIIKLKYETDKSKDLLLRNEDDSKLIINLD